MEAIPHSTLDVRRVAFFGGQGSRAVFSRETSAAAIRHIRASRTAAGLLESCYNAFVQEISAAKEGKQKKDPVLLELTELTSPESLVSPPTTHQTNPIIQGIALLVHQILSYLNHVENNTVTQEPQLSWQAMTRWDEVVGFCSGIIPSLVIATSTSVEEFITASEHATRLAFWIGYRVAVFCEERAGPQWRARPWSIAVSKLQEEDVIRFNSQDGNETVCFSARLNPDIITVTGTPAALEQFKVFSEGNGDPVPVHGWYHGGDTTESVVQSVLQDLTQRSISFPSQQDLHVPVRSTVDGTLMTVSGENPLAETAVRTILTHRLNWQQTWDALSLGTLKTEVHAFGPHSRSFFGGRSRNTRVVDHSLPERAKAPHADIAIVGMSVNFPSASNKETLWQNLEKGVNTVQTIPDTRFNLSEYTSDNPGKPGLRSVFGNFVDKPWAFDNAFFDISPREARSMDPQQKLLLQATLHALDDAGYVPDSTPSFQKDSMGCYVGIATGDYVDNLHEDIDVYYSTGTLRAFLSGRISYTFKFSGPSMVVDTACSASSIAIHQACQALSNGDCTAAVAGGANAILSPDMHTGLGRAHFLSPTGQCKAFDAGADGYCRSEGCGVFVLKRLSDALEENDRIYGVIRGIAVNQSANASSITRPHPETQAKLFRTVLSRAGVDASSVDVVEAHGTGTQAGDAVEISSIQSVFGKTPPQSQKPVFITSIKGNIGHAEAASGAASLAKVLLMLANHRIPPQVGLKTINPRLAGALVTGLQITTEGANWEAPGDSQPRRAMINNFGAAGSNAAMVVEEAPSRHFEGRERSAYPFVISARTMRALKTRVQTYSRLIEASRSKLRLADICYTATARRRRYEHMVSFACGNVDDLLAKLGDPTFTQAPSTKRPLIMVFSGQGAAYSGMGRELLSTCPLYRTCVDRCERLLQEMGFPSIRGILEGDLGNQISDTYMSQTGTFVLQYALASVWQAWGVEPQVVIGHSLGEYAAMAIAGIMSLADALRLVATRATLISDLCIAKETGMMACNQNDEEMLRLISRHEGLARLQVACQNTRRDSVISGPIAELQALAELCNQAGYRYKMLAVPYGFHSTAMDPILEEVRKVASSATYYPPKLRFGSTVFGDFLSWTLDPDYIVRQTRDTVKFAQLLQTITADQALSSAVFLEIGPSTITLPMVRNGVPEHAEYGFLSSLNGKLSAWASLSSAAISLSAVLPNINWRAVFDGTGASVIDAPEYPLEPAEHYVPYRETRLEKSSEGTKTQDSKLDTGLLTTKLQSQDNVFETPVEYIAPYIEGHIVGGVALCPASIYHEMAVEAATLKDISPDQTIAVTDLTFDNPLVYSVSPDDRIVQLRLEKEKPFQFSSCSPLQPGNPTVHCSGTLSLESTALTTKSFARKAAMIQRQLTHLKLRREQFDTFNTNTLYETIFTRVVRYAHSYRSIRQLTVADTGLEGYGTFKLPVIHQKCVLSPAFIDTLLHSVGFMANNYAASSEVYICTKVESARVLFQEVDQKDTFSLYCSLLNCDENVLIADSYALSPSGRLVAAVEGIHFKKLNLRAFHGYLSRYQTNIRLQLDTDSSSTVSSASSDDSMSTGESSLSTPPNSDDEALPIAPLVTRVISKICGVDILPSSTCASLAELGIDSLMAIEIGSALQKQLPQIHLDSSTIMEMRTIGDLTREVEKLVGKTLDAPKETRPKLNRQASSYRGKVEKVKGHDTPNRTRIKSILAGVCGIPEFGLRADQPVSAYGVDSLLSMEVRQAFKKNLKVDISAEQLHPDLTVGGLEDLIMGMSRPKNKASDAPRHTVRPILLQKGDPGSASAPLVLIHDGSGSAAPYSKLKRVPFPVYGISSPNLGLEPPTATSLKQLATLYAESIRSTFDGSVVIGGWSFGGVLAFEIAQHLASQVEGVILIDSPSPIDHTPLPDTVIRYVLQDLDAGGQEFLRTQFTRHAAMLGEYRPSKLQTDLPFVLLQSEETLNTTTLCGIEYPWLENQATQQESVSQWNTLLQSTIRVLQIPGNHFEPFKLQNVPKVTEKLVEAYSHVVG
ncbi:uncharacterized protein BJX67DRAFT_379556 [Aspergillus lucknowensis]|uniref:Polyketide synthase n=1 Tax=Aspergillus lucknowensis TaxID=176173 RepID=A0ABR4LX06_9EURO